MAHNALFLRYKKNLILQYGKDGLWNDQIDYICKGLTPWRGCHNYKNAVFKSGYQIINTSIAGTHWVAIYISRNKIYIYDSFARPISRLLNRFIKLIPHKYTIIECNTNDAEQVGYSQVCGHISIAWLMVVKKLGIKKACLI